MVVESIIMIAIVDIDGTITQVAVVADDIKICAVVVLTNKVLPMVIVVANVAVTKGRMTRVRIRRASASWESHCIQYVTVEHLIIEHSQRKLVR